MDLTQVAQFVSNVGFPIVCCFGCYKIIENMRQSHADEVKALAESVNNNTLVMQKLIDQIELLEVLTKNASVNPNSNAK